VRGALRLQQATLETDSPQRTRLLQAARSDLEAAIAGNRFLAGSFGDELEQAQGATRK
jgi:hypothetical protein